MSEVYDWENELHGVKHNTTTPTPASNSPRIIRTFSEEKEDFKEWERDYLRDYGPRDPKGA